MKEKFQKIRFCFSHGIANFPFHVDFSIPERARGFVNAELRRDQLIRVEGTTLPSGMDDDVREQEELAAEEWRAGLRIKVPLVYETTSAAPEKNPMEQTPKNDSSETTPLTRRVHLLPRIVDEEIYLKEVHREILKRLHDRYTSEPVPCARSPRFPEFPPSRPSREMEIIASLRPFGARFIHYPENYAECYCVISPQFMNYFKRRFIRPPCDRFDEDYFGDVNFQKFLLGLFDQFALLHHSRTFTVIGFYSETWYLVTFGAEITERLFRDRSDFIADLKLRLEEAHSLAWPKSFLMCPGPHPQSLVIPMKDEDEHLHPTYSYQDDLLQTSSPELLREADRTIEFACEDAFNLSGADEACIQILDTAFLEQSPEENSVIDLNVSSASSLDGELPFDSDWLDSETLAGSSDLSLTELQDELDSSDTTPDLFSFEESVEDDVFFCLQEILAVVLSDCTCQLHETTCELMGKNHNASIVPIPAYDVDLESNARLQSRTTSREDLESAARTASLNEFYPLIDTTGSGTTAHKDAGDPHADVRSVLIDLDEKFSVHFQPVVTSSSLKPSEMSATVSEHSGTQTQPSPQRKYSEPPHRSIIQLTPGGASFRKASAKRCVSLPPTGMGPSREESLFLADTIAVLRPYGVRFIADLRGYSKCSCRPSSAIAELWRKSKKIGIEADFDMDQFGDMLLANFIMARNSSGALLLHYAGIFDSVTVDQNQWTFIYNDYGEVKRKTFDNEEALFLVVKKRISKMFSSQHLLEKYICPLPEGTVQNDTSSEMVKRAVEVKQRVESNVARRLSSLENQKENLRKKFASFITRMSN